jgi:hypothetical protein
MDKSIKRSVLRQLAEPIKQTRLREEDYLRETLDPRPFPPGRRRIAIYSLHHFSGFEYSLAMWLHLRGHDIRRILCEGFLPLCEMNLGPSIDVLRVHQESVTA